MTKTQEKRALIAIKQKARSLWGEYPMSRMSTQDMIAIEKICDKYLKKL